MDAFRFVWIQKKDLPSEEGKSPSKKKFSRLLIYFRFETYTGSDGQSAAIFGTEAVVSTVGEKCFTNLEMVMLTRNSKNAPAKFQPLMVGVSAKKSPSIDAPNKPNEIVPGNPPNIVANINAVNDNRIKPEK